MAKKDDVMEVLFEHLKCFKPFSKMTFLKI